MPERVRRIAEYKRRADVAARRADAAVDDEEEAAFLQLAAQLLRQAEALEGTLHADGLLTPHHDTGPPTDAKRGHGDAASGLGAGKRESVVDDGSI